MILARHVKSEMLCPSVTLRDCVGKYHMFAMNNVSLQSRDSDQGALQIVS
jgi:hypothetical protein